MQLKPNRSRIVARILSKRPAEDGWGAWVKLDVDSAQAVPGFDHFSKHLSGTQVKVFVPPPLVDAVSIGQNYEGDVTVRGGPGGDDVYSLVPDGARPAPKS
jgi:hypothetical protein